MRKKTGDDIRQAMERINWNFEDFNSSKYPLDLNSIPWYPATFPAPIPKFLIALLSESEDVIFDPFGGKGTTSVEALKQRRRFVYNDLNPHAALIMKCMLDTIIQSEDEMDLLHLVEDDRAQFQWQIKNDDFISYQGKNNDAIFKRLPADITQKLDARGIKRDVVYWFHAETLKELVCLFDYINQFCGLKMSIRKLAFLSVLKEVSSQRGHFSYVTDNCRPVEMKYYNAFDAYLDMIDRIQKACVDFNRQYKIINKKSDLKELSSQCVIHTGDAKDCAFMPDHSVDLIITSPPYLCAQDYILTMRLNEFFFPNEGFESLPSQEIGPRRLRSRAGIVDSYFSDMNSVFRELYRVLKDDSFFCLVIGQGKGKISEHIDVVSELVENAKQIGFSLIFETTRTISFRTNRVGGVDKEHIILFRK